MIDLSVIIVNWNTKKLLLDCLSSIFKQTKGLDYEVIVVDNGSTDGSVEEVEKRYSDITILRNKTNLGFAKANNQGIKIARGKYILLLNSDTKIIGNAMKKLVDFADSKPNLGVVGPRLLNQNGSHQPSTAPFFTLPRVALWFLTGDRFLYSSPTKTGQVDWLMGSALMVSRKAIDKAGLLDEKIFMYMEDVDWCYRIKRAGWQIWFYAGVEIYHLVRGSSPEGKKNAILGIYQGLIYFYQKHFACWQVSVLKFLLRAKALGAWFLGVLTGNKYLKETYGKVIEVVR